MQAMILEFPAPIASGPLQLKELPPPLPASGEIVIEVSYCGLCRADLHLVEGELPPVRLPLIPGHQVVGRVAEVGPRQTKFQLGERVGLSWLVQVCGHCEYCRTGRENLCHQAEFTGWHRDGGLAQYVAAPAEFVFRLPAKLDDAAAAPLLGSGSLAYRALKRCFLQPGGRLGLFGFGGTAHLALQIAQHRKSEVFVFSQNQARRELARRLGAAWVGDLTATPPAPLDHALICTPVGSLVPQALQHLKRGGNLVLAGVHLPQIPPLVYHEHLYYEKSLGSVTAATRVDTEEILELAADIPIRPEIEIFPLSEANQALKLLKAGRLQGTAVLAVNPGP